MGQEEGWAARSGQEMVSLRPEEVPSAVPSDIAAVKLVSLLHVLEQTSTATMQGSWWFCLLEPDKQPHFSSSF